MRSSSASSLTVATCASGAPECLAALASASAAIAYAASTVASSERRRCLPRSCTVAGRCQRSTKSLIEAGERGLRRDGVLRRQLEEQLADVAKVVPDRVLDLVQRRRRRPRGRSRSGGGAFAAPGWPSVTDWVRPSWMCIAQLRPLLEQERLHAWRHRGVRARDRGSRWGKLDAGCHSRSFRWSPSVLVLSDEGPSRLEPSGSNVPRRARDRRVGAFRMPARDDPRTPSSGARKVV